MKKAILLSLLWAAILSFPWWAQGKNFTATDYLKNTSTTFEAGSIPQNSDMLDNPLIFLPNEIYLSSALKAGRLPFWNPTYYTGVPIFCDGQSGYFYLPRLILLKFLPVEAFWHLSLFGHLFFAGVAAYALGRQRGLSQTPALLLGTAWMLNGPCLTWLECGHLSVLTMWLPVCLLAVRKAGHCWRWVGVAALALFGLITGGHLQYVFYACVVIFSDALWGLRGRGRSYFLRTAASGLLGICLALPMLLPTSVELSNSQRSDRAPEYFVSSYQQYLSTVLPTIVMPDAWGTPANGFEFRRVSGYGNFIYPEFCLFCGNGVVFLAILALLSDSRARRWALAFAILLALPATPIYLWLFHVTPGLSKIVPTRLGWVITLVASFLAAHGLQSWENGRATIGTRRAVSVLALLAAGGILAWVSHIANQPWNSQALRLPDSQIFPDARSFLQAAQAGFHKNYAWTSLSVWPPVLCLISVAICLQFNSARARYTMIALVAAEMLLFGLRFNPVQDGPFYPDNPIARHIASICGSERCVGLSTIKPNQFEPFNASVLEGYSSFYPGGTARVLGYLANLATEAPRPNAIGQIVRVDSPWIDALNVGYGLALVGQPVPPSWQPIPGGEPLQLYRNPSRLERVRVVGEARVEANADAIAQQLREPSRMAFIDRPIGELGGGGTARIASYAGERVEIEAQVQGRCLVVLADAFSPGWHVTVDGVPQAVIRCDAMLRGVVVEEGGHRIVFTYAPPGFSTGLTLAGISLLICLSLSGFSLRRGRLSNVE